MNSFVEFMQWLLPLGSLIGVIALTAYSVVFLLHFRSSTKFKLGEVIVKNVRTNAIFYALLITLAATLGSLFYSEMAGLAPCTLCWYQRILIYPLVVFFGLMVLKKQTTLSARETLYPIVMSLLGVLLALYHLTLQNSEKVSELAPCNVSLHSASCSESYFVEYGFISIPVMSLLVFLSLLFILKTHIKK